MTASRLSISWTDVAESSANVTGRWRTLTGEIRKAATRRAKREQAAEVRIMPPPDDCHIEPTISARARVAYKRLVLLLNHVGLISNNISSWITNRFRAQCSRFDIVSIRLFRYFKLLQRVPDAPKSPQMPMDRSHTNRHQRRTCTEYCHFFPFRVSPSKIRRMACNPKSASQPHRGRCRRGAREDALTCAAGARRWRNREEQGPHARAGTPKKRRACWASPSLLLTSNPHPTLLPGHSRPPLHSRAVPRCASNTS